MNYGFSCAITYRSLLTVNLKSMYNGIKQAIGPMQSRTAPLKSATGDAIKDKSKQMACWMEHYSELYSRVNVVSEEALMVMESLSTMDELDSESILEEINQALEQLSSGKAPGNDGISVEVIKCAKRTLLKELHEILCQCWREGEVPQDMRDANIVTLYKNKGDRGDCKGDNYRGISLLNIVGKLFAKVVLMKLQVLAERLYPESQYGFRAKRTTIDMFFTKTASRKMQRAGKATLCCLY